MPIDPRKLLLDRQGHPQPSPELVQRIRERCRLPLTLRYRSAAWGVDREWAETDPRWARVQSGEMSREMAFDNIGELPLYVGLDEAPAFLERMLRTYPVEEYRKLADNIGLWNAEGQGEQLVEEVIAATRDEMGKHDEITSAIFAATPVQTVAAQQDAKAVKDRMAKARAAKAAKKASA